MPSTVTFPTDRAGLLACSDALAGVRLWAESARFGELAVPVGTPGTADGVEVAWRLLRAGRPEQALALLDGLPADAHPLLPALRAAAVAVRDRTPGALSGLLEVLGAQRATPISLKLVVAAALAAGDRATALDTASRYLATVNAEDPELLGLTAPEQAAAGDIVPAVTSAERAAAGRVDPDQAIREIVAQLRATGHDDIAYRFLAEGAHRTSREIYGALLAETVPRRVRDLNGDFVLGFAPILAAIGLVATAVPLLIAVGVLCGVAGIGLAGSAMFARLPGCTRTQTRRIVGAVDLHRARHGATGLVRPAVGWAVGFFGVALMLGRDPVAGFAVASLAVGAVAAGVAWLVRRRRRARHAVTAQYRVPAVRCRCWELDCLAGDAWRTYLDEHLAPVAADEPLGAVLLRCPTTGKTWLGLPPRPVAVAVRLPGDAEPEPGYPGGTYL